MLPTSSENGDLPPGIHAAGLDEIERRFGSENAARARAMATLRHLHELALRTGFLSSFYVFGSFASAEPEPRDIDVVLIMDATFKVEECPRESRTLFLHADAQARYGASIFWLRRGMLTQDALDEFMRVWQTRRDGTVRGILEVA